MHKTKLHNYLTIGLLTMLLAACSTEKEALLNKGYHNMTARYNGYYNARVIIEEALDNYRAGYQDDYNQILPLDLYPTEADAPNLFPEMEDAIKRCETVIVRHSMPNPKAVQNKSEEHCRWIDDNWLVIAKAHYVKREYRDARQKLKYISESEFYTDEESVYEARIWLARTHIALGEYAEAKRVLILVENSIKKSEEKADKDKKRPSKLERKRARQRGDKKDKGPAKFPKKMKLEYELAMSELYIAQDNYKKAIEHLENAIPMERWQRKRRARHMFVLAQLYDIEGNGSQAAYYFDKVAKSNAPYEMRFKAKIRNALSTTGNSEEVVEELEKMLKDGKNLEYKDQIYYALAEIDMKKPDEKQAKINYTKSVLWSINNNRQKGISYLRLADMSFAEKDYLSAQKYYDSCVNVLPEDYEDYEKLKNKAEGLSALVENYETMVFEDSVQMIGQMSPKEREKFIKQVIKDIKEEEERKKREAEQKLLAQQKRVNQQQGAGGIGGRKWYFSNPKLIASGFNEFRSLWGQRVLEDNWRRSNKASLNQLVDENGEVVDSLQEDELTVDMLMADIPLTPPALDSSNNRLLNSLYNLGIIYKEQLKEIDEAKRYFQLVIDKRIEHPKVLPALYQLYLIHNKNGDPKAGQYKSTILNNYPDSEIAQILKDPDYLKKKEIKDREELLAYGNVMRNYRRRSYGLVITACNEVIQNEPENQFLHKYYLLKAFAVSQINPGNEEAISAPLKELIELAPETEEGRQAQVYLDRLKKGGAIEEPVIDLKDSPYVVDMDTKHFFILFFPTKAGSILDTKNKVSDFNGVFFDADGLTLQDAPLGSEYQVLVVRSFDDIEAAQTYLRSFESEKGKETLGTIPADFQHALINTKNFGTLFKTRDVETYLLFYKQNY
jgi:tetratricopeptide (TPR) repeat protein